ncbi:glycosyltransferase family 4 protein [Chitinophaga sancti]|uniref:Glycosyltransferase family 4 protein n=1 Tax=Chitinophaga sancti TaxID=1004 RepID=A0A1K1N7S7_9BACT|nr:glycosyltransferase family 4 protein [Chitinophaga sancti]WQD63481.1 glycosyltransferase family 4 protein [Chitinophaga sancti]WQG90893.1 glycosyltransferase family 4 protein [Chitinophaga sancti]SFW31377.1 Glycosyltransferase involved in cell wall bisynthesis [Chitinophaga sancti]
MNNTPKIKVLQAIRQGLIGGGESHVLSLVDAMDKERFEPVVLSFTDGAMITRLQEMGIRHYVIPSLKAFDPSCWKRVKTLIQDEQIDIVHAHGSRAASNLYIPARMSGRPLLYTIHGWSFHDDQPFLQKQARIWSERLLTSGTKANISVSASNRDTGVQHFSGFKSTVINNGIDLSRFNPDNAANTIRTELGIPASNTVVGYIARITHQKDPFTLVYAFKKVLEQHSNITLLVVGEGDLKEGMVSLAATLGIADHIVFQPFRGDVPALLQAIDVYCLPSLWEGLPIGLLEAMAMRKAVIVTAVDGSKEIVADRQNGLVVPARDPAALATAIGTLHTDVALRTSLQQAAAATVNQHYCAKGMTRQVEHLYRNVLDHKN